MTEKPIQEPLTGEIITNPNQDALIAIDQDNQLTASPQFQEVLAQMTTLSEQAKQIIAKPISEVDEAEFSAEKKALKPMKQYHKVLTKDIPKMIREHYDTLKKQDLKRLQDALDESGFTQFENIDKQIRQREKDKKADRVNKRWAKLKTYFDANLTLYPELTKLAPNTLGSFDHYRTLNSDLVSSAKTKPLKEADIKKINDDMHSYHENLTRLTDTDLNKEYMQSVITQYAAEPSTDNMLELIDQALSKQNKDLQLATQNKVKPLALKIAQKTLITPAIKDFLKSHADQSVNPDELDVKLTGILTKQARKIADQIIPMSFVDNGMINEQQLTESIKTACKNQLNDIVKQVKTLNQKQPTKQTESKWEWLNTYINNHEQYQDLTHNEKAKVLLISNLYDTMTNSDSIWHNHLKSYHDILELTAYLLNY